MTICTGPRLVSCLQTDGWPERTLLIGVPQDWKQAKNYLIIVFNANENSFKITIQEVQIERTFGFI